MTSRTFRCVSRCEPSPSQAQCSAWQRQRAHKTDVRNVLPERDAARRHLSVDGDGHRWTLSSIEGALRTRPCSPPSAIVGRASGGAPGDFATYSCRARNGCTSVHDADGAALEWPWDRPDGSAWGSSPTAFSTPTASAFASALMMYDNVSLAGRHGHLAHAASRHRAHRGTPCRLARRPG